MKKSEKIEIRISPEDKEALARKAEEQGRTASEVVRDLLQSGGVVAQAETVKERSGIGALLGGGLFLAGAALGAAAVLFFPQRNVPDALMRVEFVIESAPGGDRGVVHRSAEMILPSSKLDQAEAFLSMGPDDGYRFSVEEVPKAKGVSLVRVLVCRPEGEGCPLVAAPTVVRAENGAAEASGETPDGAEIFFSLLPAPTTAD